LKTFRVAEKIWRTRIAQQLSVHLPLSLRRLPLAMVAGRPKSGSRQAETTSRRAATCELFHTCRPGSPVFSVTLLTWKKGEAMVDTGVPKRVALVIGNSGYAHEGALPNPRNDASDVADALRRLGFSVRLGIDVTCEKFLRTIAEFARVAQGADAA